MIPPSHGNAENAKRESYHLPQQGSRRNPAKWFRWEEDERQRERVLPLAAGRGIRRPLGRRRGIDRDEQTAGTGWEPEREVFLQVDRLAPGFQPAGGPQVDHAGADPWHGDTGGLVWCGGDPRPVPLMSAVAGLAAVGTLMDEDEDTEEKRRRMEAKIAAENFGAVVGFAAGTAIVVKEKLDEQAMWEEQKKQQHEQTMGGM